jgi:hypothetical protein
VNHRNQQRLGVHEHAGNDELSTVRDNGAGSAHTSEQCLRGSILVLMLYDICEEIRLDMLARILGTPITAPSPKTSAPERIRFARPPLVERIDSPRFESGECAEAQIKYYDYGVVSLIFEVPFTSKWTSLVELASRWIWDVECEKYARATVEQKLPRAAPSLVKPYSEWLSEDYFIFQVRQIPGFSTSAELLSQFGQQIAQMVRGEVVTLSEAERSEILQSRVSYYQNDLAVVGWNSAFVYDTAAGAQTATELLEYANSQLLEFRHYDELLSGELEGVYRSLGMGTGTMARWRLAREATRLHTVLLEVMELTERADNAIKFLGDMFSARFYRLAAGKIGVPDYKNLVTQKLRTAEELYRFMVDQFHQGRAFVLEAVVVVILVVELVYLFYGQVMYR